ncbi:gp85 [Bacillus phage G]|uniref:Gp85 n=1 Tax=Bacillus phage G TaxID=2884420 RepID=G3MBF5_9CAUD|nr:gp85 [Bacillus phage G]AEO93356.1 gp85 [Bacillus phage G]
MSKRWTAEEDKLLAVLMLKYIQGGESVRKSALIASKEMKNRTYEACYTRWTKTLKKKNDSPLKKEDYDKAFITLIIDLFKENQLLSYRLTGLERKYQKIEKKIEIEQKPVRRIGFLIEENE